MLRVRIIYIFSNRTLSLSLLDSFGEIIDAKGHNDVKTRLLQIRDDINNYKKFNKRKYQSFDAYNEFIDGTYSNFTNGLTIFVLEVSIIHNQFGNCIGSILNDYACAELAGAHFLIVGDNEEGGNNIHSDYYFPQLLPNVI